MNDVLATTQSKLQLENSVLWYLTEQHLNLVAPVVTAKFLTRDNLLVHLTLCNALGANVPRIQVQVYRRVPGGVQETGYQLFGDHRFERYENPMIFGDNGGGAPGVTGVAVTEAECTELLELLASLHTAQKRL